MKTKKNIRPPFPIDVVYTWAGEKKSNNIRKSFHDELKYSLRSVERFAPWINKIYILMNTYKQPSWIKPNDKIIIVEHKDTFPSKEYLPNSNSNAIETTLCNIPNLSEHYIYFNDDFFIGKPINYTYFFTPDGKAKIMIHALQSKRTLKHGSKLHFLFPPNNHQWYGHVPIPYIKSLLVEFNKTYPDFIHWIRSTKHRIKGGVDICQQNNLNEPCQQLHYPIAKYMYLKKQAIPKKIKEEYINATNFMHKIPNILIHKPTTFCINDDERDMEKRKIFYEHIYKFYNEYFPIKASFEL
jgi:hypothetical protein